MKLILLKLYARTTQILSCSQGKMLMQEAENQYVDRLHSLLNLKPFRYLKEILKTLKI